ncbi:MAG TPA: DUF4198 domain-containing protein [Planctomycetaceae bacterium]|nr:DUF4198 domain-containing protein [Planctomycetaceae bacterium]
MFKVSSTALTFCFLTTIAAAHDTWVQTNTNIIRMGDAVHVDLMLGNHGNEHRDFKLASKITLDGVTLRLHGPKGSPLDLASRLVDVGYTPKEGFWTTKAAVTEPGLYLIEHTLDKVVNHGKPQRSVRSAKTFFVAAKNLGEIPHENPGFDKVLGHPLELVPESSTVTPMGPDVPIRVKVLFQNKPLAGARVAFIPRGVTLSEGIDANHERTTNDNGRASFTPKDGNYYLVVVHHETAEKGTDYEGSKYTATLTVFVPDVCPCCGE